MPYRVLADIVVLVHFLWVLFLIFGAFIGARSRPARVLHLAGLGYAAAINALSWYCPLTHIEVWARARHDPALAYTGSFVIHYLEELIYVELSRTSLLFLTLALLAFNAWYYLKKGGPFKRRRG